MNGVRMSCVVGQKFGRMYAAAGPASSPRYCWISHRACRHEFVDADHRLVVLAAGRIGGDDGGVDGFMAFAEDGGGDVELLVHHGLDRPGAAVHHGRDVRDRDPADPSTGR
jgi:hypothetical protein